MLQSSQLTQYHVTNPKTFLNGEDAWDMPTESGLSGPVSRFQHGIGEISRRHPRELPAGFRTRRDLRSAASSWLCSTTS